MLVFAFTYQNSNYESIQQTARSIAEQAHVLAYDPNYMSPFAQFACDNGLNVRGTFCGTKFKVREYVEFQPTDLGLQHFTTWKQLFERLLYFMPHALKLSSPLVYWSRWMDFPSSFMTTPELNLAEQAAKAF